MESYSKTKTSAGLKSRGVADPDPARHFVTDPDSAFQFDPDPAFQFDPDPDPTDSKR